MKNHRAAPTGLPVPARPTNVLYQLQQSSSPARKGVMDTPCTLENTQIYASCGKKKSFTGHKDTSQKPRAVTHTQDGDVWWSHHCTWTGADHRPCRAQKMFVTVRHILPRDQEGNQQGISRELAMSGSSDVPQLHHCRSKANTQHRRCNPTVTP